MPSVRALLTFAGSTIGHQMGLRSRQVAPIGLCCLTACCGRLRFSAQIQLLPQFADDLANPLALGIEFVVGHGDVQSVAAATRI